MLVFPGVFTPLTPRLRELKTASPAFPYMNSRTTHPPMMYVIYIGLLCVEREGERGGRGGKTEIQIIYITRYTATRDTGSDEESVALQRKGKGGARRSVGGWMICLR